MIEELIRRTNLDEFYNDSNLKTESFSYSTSSQLFELILSINQISYDHNIEYEEWKISCNGTQKRNGFEFDVMMPYPKMKILDRHPLLWLYHDEHLECEIQGTPNDINKFVFDIIKLMEKEAGNWIDLKDIMWNFQSYMFKIKKTIMIPPALEEGISKICTDQNLLFRIKNYYSGEDKGYADCPNAKVLMFGNEDVSPYTYNLGQSYIISEEFTAERIK